MNTVHLSHSLAIFLVGSTTIGLGAHALAPLPPAKPHAPPVVVFELKIPPQPKAPPRLALPRQETSMLAIRDKAEAPESATLAPHVFISKNGEQVAIAIGQTLKF